MRSPFRFLHPAGVAVVGLLLAGCAADPSPKTAPAAINATQSLYDKDWIWQTDAGEPMRLSELRGKPQVVAMFFTTCSGTCGVTVSHLVQLQASLTPEQRKHVGFVLITFDSLLDTPEALAKYRAERRLPSEWKIMRGSPQATKELAAELSVPFAADPTRHILHGAQITVLDDEGRIADRVVGVNGDLDDGLVAIRSQLAAASTRPAASASAQ
jgi:protein SCO1/2